MMKKSGNHKPQNYKEVRLALEEGHHRFEYGDSEEAAHVILSVIPFLIDWGYVELAEQNILQVLKNSPTPDLSAQCEAFLGSIADLRSDYPDAFKHFEQALQFYESADNHGGIALMLFRIGRIHNGHNEFDLAKEYFLRCIQTCKEHGVTDGWAASLLGMGWNLQQQTDDVEEVLELYEQSIKLAEQSSDMETLSSAHRQVGFLLWLKRRQKEEAKAHFELALQVSREHNLVKEMGGNLTAMGYVYDEWGEYETAQESCQQAIQIFKAIGNSYGLSNAYSNLGKVFESKQDLDLAIQWYSQSRNISMVIQNRGSQAYACLQLGKILRQQDRSDEAEAFLLEAVQLGEKHKLMGTLASARKELSEIRKLPE